METKNVEAFKLLGKTAKYLVEHDAQETVTGIYRAMSLLLKDMSQEEKEALKNGSEAMNELFEILEKVY